MPDLRGLSARQAMSMSVGSIGLRAEFVGDGTVARHAPAPGEAVDPEYATATDLAAATCAERQAALEALRP